jgi:peptidoglycan/xylan/chitin deacetylase (PgdA/CDA1 family)
LSAAAETTRAAAAGVDGFRQAIKNGAAAGLHAVGADRLIGALDGRAGRVRILCYHRVVDDPSRHPASAPAMLVSTAMLERQLDWLGRRHRFVGLDELGDTLAAGRRFCTPVAAVTFDDGYADFHERAFPLLRRKGIPAAVFVVTDRVGGDRLQTHDELYVLLAELRARRGAAAVIERLRRLGVDDAGRLDDPATPAGLVELKSRLLRESPQARVLRLVERLRDEVATPPGLAEQFRPLDWAAIAELDEQGATIGSHTRSHPVLPNESHETIFAELAGSKRALERRLGHEVRHLAYPDGQFCPTTVEAAARAGYRYAYTTCRHRSPTHPLLTLSRRTFWERTAIGRRDEFSPAVCGCQVHGVFDRLRRAGCDHGSRWRAPVPFAAEGAYG